jgi:hypothetical protein
LENAGIANAEMANAEMANAAMYGKLVIPLMLLCARSQVV